MITAEELLKPVSVDQPCGEDLYYDPGFQELGILMKGKEETQFSQAEDPDWRKLHERCVDLYARTKDLRVATTFCLAAVKQDGLPGLKEALVALKELLERYWEPVHPRLDPEDDNDPLHRMNVIAALATPRGTFGDPMRFLDRVCEAPLAESPQLGRFGLGAIVASEAAGAGGGEGQSGPTKDQIKGAFRDSSSEDLVAKHRLAGELVQIVIGIDTFITSTVGSGKAPDLDLLNGQFKEIQKVLVPFLPAGTVETVTEEGTSEGLAQGGSNVGKAISGEIQSRQDVLRMLDKICDYYARTEPSSPVPGVLRRARRLTEMSFMDIIKDLCPDAEPTVRTITGEKEETTG